MLCRSTRWTRQFFMSLQKYDKAAFYLHLCSSSSRTTLWGKQWEILSMVIYWGRRKFIDLDLADDISLPSNRWGTVHKMDSLNSDEVKVTLQISCEKIKVMSDGAVPTATIVISSSCLASTTRGHQSPEWTILSHSYCLIQGEIDRPQVLLDSLYPCSSRTSWWSPPVLRRGSSYDTPGICLVWHSCNMAEQRKTPCLDNSRQAWLPGCLSHLVIPHVMVPFDS